MTEILNFTIWQPSSQIKVMFYLWISHPENNETSQLVNLNCIYTIYKRNRKQFTAAQTLYWGSDAISRDAVESIWYFVAIRQYSIYDIAFGMFLMVGISHKLR